MVTIRLKLATKSTYRNLRSSLTCCILFHLYINQRVLSNSQQGIESVFPKTIPLKEYSHFLILPSTQHQCNKSQTSVLLTSNGLNCFCPGLSARPTSSSLWCVSSPQRAWRAVVEPAAWFAWPKRSSVASLVASPPPSSRRPWRSTRS